MSQRALRYWRARAFASADRVGLDRDERLALAEKFLAVDITSWKTLDISQLARLVDALEGAHLVEELTRQRPAWRDYRTNDGLPAVPGEPDVVDRQ